MSPTYAPCCGFASARRTANGINASTRCGGAAASFRTKVNAGGKTPMTVKRPPLQAYIRAHDAAGGPQPSPQVMCQHYHLLPPPPDLGGRKAAAPCRRNADEIKQTQ